MSQTKDEAIQSWIKIAIAEARASGEPAVFWLDSKRPHDRNLIQIAKQYFKEHEISGFHSPYIFFFFDSVDSLLSSF